VGAVAGVGELVRRQESPASQSAHDRELGPLDSQVALRLASPLPPQEGVQIPVPEALDRLDHLTLEREPAELSVRDDVHAGVRLPAQDVVDRGVLDAPELVRVDLAARVRLAGGKQLPRAEEA